MRDWWECVIVPMVHSPDQQLERSVEGGCTTVPPSHCAAVEQRTKKYLYKAITNTTAHAAGT